MTALHSGLWEGKCNIPVMVVVPKKQNTFIQEEGKKEEKKKRWHLNLLMTNVSGGAYFVSGSLSPCHLQPSEAERCETSRYTCEKSYSRQSSLTLSTMDQGKRPRGSAG